MMTTIGQNQPFPTTPNQTQYSSLITPTLYDKSVLFIQELHPGVTKELLFKEFSKYGQLKQVRHFPKTTSALIAYESIAEADEAKRNLNHTRILNKEISIGYFEDKDTLNKKKKYNLFIKNIPPNLDTTILHNFLQSEFGNVASLMLKKKNESEQNLGYGYVLFEKEEDFQKILQVQEVEGKIAIKNSDYSFNVQKFSNERPKIKINRIHITGLFEKEITLEEKEEKQNKIISVFEEIKRTVGEKQVFTYFTEYNDQKKNFWNMLEFSYSNDDDEDSVYQIVKKLITSNFQETAAPGGPQISFKAQEDSERNLILLGVKNTINEAFLADWLLRVLGIVISQQNIRIQLVGKGRKAEPTPQTSTEDKNAASKYTASLFFDSKKDGQKFMIFCTKANNATQLKEIFEAERKVTLFLSSEKYNEIKKLNSNMGNYHKASFQVNTFQQKTEITDFKFQPFQPNPIPNIIYSYQPPQSGVIPIVPIHSAVSKETIQNTNKTTNIFLTFQKLSTQDKKLQVEDIAQKINTCKDEFNQISDEEGKRAILGQIIYYKIQNFGETNKQELIKELNKTPEEANKLINEFHLEVAKITGMLIDKDIFQIEEIIEIVLNPKELLERCLEATDLLAQNQQN